MSIVYDQTPEIEYDPSRGASTAGDPRISYSPHRERSTAAPTGFGGVTTRRMLEIDRPAKHPWLTVDVAREELAMQEYRRDRVAESRDSVYDYADVSP